MPSLPERRIPCHPVGVTRGPPAAADDRVPDLPTRSSRMADQTSDTPVLDLLSRMTADSMLSAGLDGQSLMLVRVAALVAVGAPPASYLANLAAAESADVDPEQLRGVLVAIAPIVGSARVVAAAGNMMEAFGIGIAAAMEAAELAAELPE